MSFDSYTQNYSFLKELDSNSMQQICDYYDYVEEEEEATPYIDLFFPFVISQEHRLSEQAVVLSGQSISHNRKRAVLKQFDLSGD